MRFIGILIGIALFFTGIFFYFQKDSFGIYRIIYAASFFIGGVYLFSINLVSLIKKSTGIYLTDKFLVMKFATRKLKFEWDAIKSFRFTDKEKTRHIGIELFDPSKFVAGQKGIIKTMAESSMRKDGVSFKIPVYAYKVVARDLLNELNDRLEKNRFHRE